MMLGRQEHDVLQLIIGVLCAMLCVLVPMILLLYKMIAKKKRASKKATDKLIPVSLETNAGLHGFVIQDVPANGNCMFEAIADQLSQVNPTGTYTADMIRERAVNHLRRSSENGVTSHYESFVSEDWETYLARMSTNGEWGDHVTLHAIANAYQRIIEVFHADRLDSTTVRPIGVSRTASIQTLYLGYNDVNHYVSLREQTHGINESTSQSHLDSEDDFEILEAEVSETESTRGDGKMVTLHTCNILVGDGARQIINAGSHNGSEAVNINYINIVSGSNSQQSVHVNFQSTKQMLKTIEDIRGDEDVRARLNVYFKTKNPEDSEEIENRVIEILTGKEESPKRTELNLKLKEIGCELETVLKECVRFDMKPTKFKALKSLIQDFRNGTLCSLVEFILSLGMRNVAPFEIDVELQVIRQPITTNMHQNNASPLHDTKKLVSGGTLQRYSTQAECNTINSENCLSKGDNRSRERKQSFTNGGQLSLVIRKPREDIPLHERVPFDDIPDTLTEAALNCLGGLETTLSRINITLDKYAGSFSRPSLGINDTSKETFETVQDMIVRIRRSNGYVKATGFRVGQNYVMTAAHVVHGIVSDSKLNDIELFLRNENQPRKVFIEFVSDKLDVAVLKIRTTTGNGNPTYKLHTPIFVTDVNPGDPFYLIGHQTWKRLAIERSVIIGNDHMKMPAGNGLENFVRFLSDKYGPGASGTPGLFVKDNRIFLTNVLIGVLLHDEYENYHVGVKMSSVYACLKKEKPDLCNCLFAGFVDTVEGETLETVQFVPCVRYRTSG